jgi:starch synthase (maltosyl-transferring)
LRVVERQRRRRIAQRWLGALVDRFVCVSTAVAEDAQQRGGLPPERLVVIPTGIDVDKLSIARPADLVRYGIAPGAPVLLWAGRPDRQKGVDWLLQIAPRILQRLPDHHLLLVGRGLDRWVQMSRDPSGQRIHFAPWDAHLPDIMRASRVLLLPSRWEGLPRVVLEAMAVGIPVVATDVQGVRQALGPLASRQIVPPGDQDEFVRAVVSLARDGVQSAEIGNQNARRVREHFSLDRMVEAYQQLYASLLTARS